MKQRIICALLAIFIGLSFAACNLSIEPPEETAAQTTSVRETTTTQATTPNTTQPGGIPQAAHGFYKVLSGSMGAISDSVNGVFSAISKSTEVAATHNTLNFEALLSIPLLEEVFPDGLRVICDADLLSDGVDTSAAIRCTTDESIDPILINAYISGDGSLYLNMPEHMDKYISIPFGLPGIFEPEETDSIIPTEQLVRVVESFSTLLSEYMGILLEIIPETAYGVETVTYPLSESGKDVKAERLTVQLNAQELVQVVKNLAARLKLDNVILPELIDAVSELISAGGDIDDASEFENELFEMLESAESITTDDINLTISLEAIFDEENLYDLRLVISADEMKLEIGLKLDPTAEYFALSLIATDTETSGTLEIGIENGGSIVGNEGYTPFALLVKFEDGEDDFEINVLAEYLIQDDGSLFLTCDFKMLSPENEASFLLEISHTNDDAISEFSIFIDQMYLIIENERIIDGMIYLYSGSEELTEVPAGGIIPELGDVLSDDEAEAYLDEIFDSLAENPAALPVLVLLMLIME